MTYFLEFEKSLLKEISQLKLQLEILQKKEAAHKSAGFSAEITGGNQGDDLRQEGNGTPKIEVPQTSDEKTSQKVIDLKNSRNTDQSKASHIQQKIVDLKNSRNNSQQKTVDLKNSRNSNNSSNFQQKIVDLKSDHDAKIYQHSSEESSAEISGKKSVSADTPEEKVIIPENKVQALVKKFTEGKSIEKSPQKSVDSPPVKSLQGHSSPSVNRSVDNSVAIMIEKEKKTLQAEREKIEKEKNTLEKVRAKK